MLPHNGTCFECSWYKENKDARWEAERHLCTNQKLIEKNTFYDYVVGKDIVLPAEVSCYTVRLPLCEYRKNKNDY